MTNSEELWQLIRDKVVAEGVLGTDDIDRISRKVISGTVDQDDWKNLVLNCIDQEQTNAS